MRARALLLILLGCSCAACATTTEPPQSAPRPRDPVYALPRGEALASPLRAYGFQQRGAAALEAQAVRLGQSGSPVARLVLARALVDGLLYTEVAQDGALLRALEALAARHHGAPDPWGWARALLSEPAAQEGPTAQAQRQGLALLEAMQSRSMDRGYHDTLHELAQQSPLWSTQARVARLLDLESALVELEQVEMGQRLALFAQVLGPRFCPEGGGVDACLPQACQGLESGAARLGACGWEALGWQPGQIVALAQPGYLLVTQALGEAQRELAQLSQGCPEPLCSELGTGLGLLEARMRAHPLVVPLPAQVVGAPPRGQLQGEAQSAAFLVARDGWLFVGRAPRLGLVTQELPWDFPGQAVGSLRQAEPEAVRDAAWLLSLWWGRAGGQPAQAPLLWCEADSPARELVRGLELARRGLARAGRLEVRLAAQSPSGGLGWRAAVVLPAEGGPREVPQAGELPALVEEVWLLLDGEGAWWVSGQRQVGHVPRGEGGALEAAQMSAQARQLRRLQSLSPTVRVRVLGARPRAGELVEVLAALEEAGLEAFVSP